MIETTPTNVFPTSRPQPSINATKVEMKATWMEGDYTRFARYMEPGARQILSDWNVVDGVKPRLFAAV